MKKIRVIIYGCGVMGRKICEALLDKNDFEVAGAIDTNPELIGKDLGEILENPRVLGIRIQDDTDLSKTNAQVAVVSTTSRLENVFPQIAKCVRAGLNVVSTCEELSYPWKKHPGLAKKIDRMAKKHGVAVLGTGINPGYLMDFLPLVLTAPCLHVDSIKVIRMIDSSKRRIPFQQKIGTGLTIEEFREKIKAGTITGHVGLSESIDMIADGLGWKLDEIVELPPEPSIAEKEVKTPLGTVKPGNVTGLKSTAYGRRKGRDIITLVFCAGACIKEEYDEIIIHGKPDIHQKMIGGVHGDIGTVAVVVNSIHRVIDASPGLKTMKDLPPPVAK